MDRDEHRRSSRASWAATAAGWERRRAEIQEVTAPVTEWLLRHLDPQPGDTLLELAAGPGDTGAAAAPMLGGTGLLISTDFAPEMVDVARRRAAELGLTNVEHRVLDAEDMDLADDAVDRVLCRFGYMLMADPAAALAETRRVLRPGGRLALAVWREGPRNPWVSLVGRILVERGLVPPPEPGTPGMFSMAADERLLALLEGAGFSADRIEEVTVHFRWADVEDYVLTARDTGGTFSRAWDQASEDERSALMEEFAEAFASFKTNGGYELPGVAACVLAQ